MIEIKNLFFIEKYTDNITDTGEEYLFFMFRLEHKNLFLVKHLINIYVLQLKNMVRKDKIFNRYKKYILYYAEIKYPPIRKRKYSLEYYLNNFTLILTDLVCWEVLDKINKDTAKYHWKSIYNEFNRWSNDGIFKDAYFKFMKENYFKMSKIRKNIVAVVTPNQ